MSCSYLIQAMDVQAYILPIIKMLARCCNPAIGNQGNRSDSNYLVLNLSSNLTRGAHNMNQTQLCKFCRTLSEALSFK